MSTITTAFILILIGFAMFYPFLFTTIDRATIDGKRTRRFLQLNYAIYLLSVIVTVFLIWINRINYPLQLSGMVYLTVVAAIILYYWKSSISKWNLFSSAIVFGFIVFYRVIKEIVEITPLWPGIFTGILAAGAIALSSYLLISSFYSLVRKNCGHFLFDKFIKYLYLFISLRIAWDAVILFDLSIETRNSEIVSALKFFWGNDPSKLLSVILTGFIIPIIMYFPFHSGFSKMNSTKRFVVMLVLFISVILAEFLYKYFLLKYGIVL